MKDEKIIERDLPTEKSNEGKGATRYVAGYCVAKLRNKYTNTIKKLDMYILPYIFRTR